MALSISQETRIRLKDVLVCGALGNLCFINQWYDLEILHQPSFNYYRLRPPDTTLLYATIVSAALLSLAFWLARRLAKRSGKEWARRAAQAAFLLVLVIPLETVRQLWEERVFRWQGYANPALVVTELALLANVLLSPWRDASRIVRVCRRITLLLGLMFPSILVDFTVSHLNAPAAAEFAARGPAPALPTSPGPRRRVIWMLFDELDQRLVFDERPPSLQLPELDRLRTEAVSADHVLQAAGWTLVAIPALISGRTFAEAEGPPSFIGRMDLDDLHIIPPGSSTELGWHTQPHLFAEARHLGLNGAVVGWYHPYCRMLGDSLTYCYAEPSGHASPSLLRERRAADEGLPRTVWSLFTFQAATLLDLLPNQGTTHADFWNYAYLQRRQQQRYFSVRQHTMELVRSGNFDLLLVHWPTPHPYGIYDRRRGDFKLSDSLTYLDNLALVDRTLGEVRRALERRGMWDSTTLLVSSDHGFRPDVWRGLPGWNDELRAVADHKSSPIVPFLLKLAGQHEPATYPEPFGAVIMHDLTLAVLRGEVRTPEDALGWLDAHRDAGPPLTGAATRARSCPTCRPAPSSRPPSTAR